MLGRSPWSSLAFTALVLALPAGSLRAHPELRFTNEGAGALRIRRSLAASDTLQGTVWWQKAGAGLPPREWARSPKPGQASQWVLGPGETARITFSDLPEGGGYVAHLELAMVEGPGAGVVELRVAGQGEAARVSLGPEPGLRLGAQARLVAGEGHSNYAFRGFLDGAEGAGPAGSAGTGHLPSAGLPVATTLALGAGAPSLALGGGPEAAGGGRLREEAKVSLAEAKGEDALDLGDPSTSAYLANRADFDLLLDWGSPLTGAEAELLFYRLDSDCRRETRLRPSGGASRICLGSMETLEICLKAAPAGAGGAAWSFVLQEDGLAEPEDRRECRLAYRVQAGAAGTAAILEGATQADQAVLEDPGGADMMVFSGFVTPQGEPATAAGQAQGR